MQLTDICVYMLNIEFGSICCSMNGLTRCTMRHGLPAVNFVIAGPRAFDVARASL